MNGRGVVIVKAGGSSERFSEAKLRRCVRIVLHETKHDPDLASPLARAVALHLQEQGDPERLCSQYVFECASAVLQQTSLADAARRLEAHRNHRAEARRRLRVFDPNRPKRGCAPWKKAAVVGVLENRFGVRHAVARALAGDLEARVFGLGYRIIRLPLLLAMIENELMSWGLLGDFSANVDAALWSKPVGARWPQREE